MAQHFLDNPVWHALISGNKSLAQGTDKVKIFAEEVSPIVGLESFTPANFSTLYDISTSKKPVFIFSVNDQLIIPEFWKLLAKISGFQMVFTPLTVPYLQENRIVLPLTTEHVSQMLALTALTNPGPFSTRTIEFGNYEGIFKDDKLVAMAGHRLQPFQYVEISAVCTHRGFVRKGFAKQLLHRQVRQIVKQGGLPFLHVKDNNNSAMYLYQKLGFEIRSPMYFYVLEKDMKKDQQ